MRDPPSTPIRAGLKWPPDPAAFERHIRRDLEGRSAILRTVDERFTRLRSFFACYFIGRGWQPVARDVVEFDVPTTCESISEEPF